MCLFVQVVTRIERVEVESDTCKIALEKCSTSLSYSQKETRCLRSQMTTLDNKNKDVEHRLTEATQQVRQGGHMASWSTLAKKP